MLRAGVGSIRLWVAPGRPVRPGRGPVCHLDFRLGPLAHLAGRRFYDRLPPRFLVSRGHRVPGHTRAAGGAQRPGTPPAPDQQACDLALDAIPQRRGHCPGHRRRSPRRRIQELNLPSVLSVHRRFCRGLLVLLAQPGLRRPPFSTKTGGWPFKPRRCSMTPWRPSWRRSGCPGSAIAGAWRVRRGLPGGAWWTFPRQKHPPGEQGLSHSPADRGVITLGK